jgi:hypothetical protein
MYKFTRRQQGFFYFCVQFRSGVSTVQSTGWIFQYFRTAWRSHHEIVYFSHEILGSLVLTVWSYMTVKFMMCIINITISVLDIQRQKLNSSEQMLHLQYITKHKEREGT